MPEPRNENRTDDRSNDGVIYDVSDLARMWNLKPQTANGKVEYCGPNPAGHGATEDGFILYPEGNAWDRKTDTRYNSWEVAKLASLEYAQYAPCNAYIQQNPDRPYTNGTNGHSNGNGHAKAEANPIVKPIIPKVFDTRSLEERGITGRTQAHFGIARTADEKLGVMWKYPTYHPDGTVGKSRVKYREPMRWVVSGRDTKPRKYLWLPAVSEHHTEPVGYNLNAVNPEDKTATAVWLLNGEPAVWLAYQEGLLAVSMFGEGRKFDELLAALKYKGITDIHVLPDYDETGLKIAREAPILAKKHHINCHVHLWPGKNPLGYDFADFYEERHETLEQYGVPMPKTLLELPLATDAELAKWEKRIANLRAGIEDIDDAPDPEPPPMPDPTKHTKNTPKRKEGEKAEVGAPAQASRLKLLVEDYPVFKTEDDESCIVFEWQGKDTTALIDSDLFTYKLHELYRDHHNGWLDEKATKLIVTYLKGKAESNPNRRPAFCRIGHAYGNIYIDCADTAGHVVEIGEGLGEDGKADWRVVLNPNHVYFRRTADTLPMPLPVRLTPAEREQTWQEFNDLIWSGREDPKGNSFILMVAWLISSLRPSYTNPPRPYVALAVSGAQNSGKTFVTKMLRTLIDPCRITLPNIPADEQNLAIKAKWSHVLAFGNLSGIPRWCSDAFCRIVEDGCFETRALYKDDTMKTFQATKALLLNGICDFMGEDDFKRRCIFLTMPPFKRGAKQQQDEPVLWARFDALWPRLLGCLCDAMACGLATIDSVPAQVDAGGGLQAFARWVVACSELLPFTDEEFLSAYRSNRHDAAAGSLEDNRLARALLELSQRNQSAHFRTADLHRTLTYIAARQMIGEDALSEMTDDFDRRAAVSSAQRELNNDRNWPKENKLTQYIKRMQESLIEIGIFVHFRETGDHRGWVISSTESQEEREAKRVAEQAARDNGTDDEDLASIFDDEDDE